MYIKIESTKQTPNQSEMGKKEFSQGSKPFNLKMSKSKAYKESLTRERALNQGSSVTSPSQSIVALKSPTTIVPVLQPSPRW